MCKAMTVVPSKRSMAARMCADRGLGQYAVGQLIPLRVEVKGLRTRPTDVSRSEWDKNNARALYRNPRAHFIWKSARAFCKNVSPRAHLFKFRTHFF